LFRREFLTVQSCEGFSFGESRAGNFIVVTMTSETLEFRMRIQDSPGCHVVRHWRATDIPMPERDMPLKVLLNYSSLDKDMADRVCNALEAAGSSCRIAPGNIEHGADYAAIVEEIHSAQILELILTQYAAASPPIIIEVGHAFNGKKRIIAFHLSADSLPENLEYIVAGKLVSEISTNRDWRD
jgi:hypothetical protein